MICVTFSVILSIKQYQSISTFSSNNTDQNNQQFKTINPFFFFGQIDNKSFCGETNQQFKTQ